MTMDSKNCIKISDSDIAFLVGKLAAISEYFQESAFTVAFRGLDFLQGWSAEQLERQEGKIFECCYRRAAVIVKNSNCSRWICVVKSGSAQVLLALDKVRPKLSTVSPQRPQTSRTLQRHRQALPAEAPYPRRSHAAPAVPTEPADREQPFITQRLPTRPQTTPGSPEEKLAKNSRGRRPPTAAASGPAASPSRSAALREQSFAFVREDELEEDPAASLVATNQLDRRYHRYDNETDMQLPAQPEFARLRTLTRGEAFGLQELFRTDQPSLSLVSGSPGTRCLLFEKAYFVEQSPKQLLDRLRNQVAHYPNRPELQRRLQERVNWEAYKRLRVRLVLEQAGKRLA